MMRLFTSVVLTFLSLGLFAQAPSYVDFEWDILRLGYAASSAESVSGGLSFGGELRYNATDNFSIGISGDGNVFGSDFDGDTDLGATASSLLVGDYYLRNDSAHRPFFGVGAGIYRTGTITIRNGSVEETIKGTSGFGIAPRVGYEFGHIRLQGQYNIALREEHSNYFGLTVALTLWGGYNGGSTSKSKMD